jgi:AcrR family transcriptional regulator
MARKPADQSVSRDEILQAAAEVLRKNGVEASTMKDIAAKVNLTAASLYHHFENKDTLVLAVLELGLQHASSDIEAVLNTELPLPEKLRRLIRVHVTSLTANPRSGAAMIFEANPPPPPPGKSVAFREYATRREAYLTQRRRFEGYFRDVLNAGIDSGVFRPVDVPTTARAILGANNWVAVWYQEGGRLDGEQIAAQIADVFVAGLLMQAHAE